MFKYRDADYNDISLLVKLRFDFLNVSESDKDYNRLYTNLEEYFKTKLSSQECMAILVENRQSIIGTGIIFFYRSVPSISNIEGRNAYISNLYVDEPYRRQKIGTQILTILIEKAKQNNCNTIFLHASDMGRKLYQSYGFKENENSMIYKMTEV